MQFNEEFWKRLDAEHHHVNRDYVKAIMRSLNADGYLNKKGKKALEELITNEMP